MFCLRTASHFFFILPIILSPAGAAWGEGDSPNKEVQPIEIHVDLDTAKFYKMFVDLPALPRLKEPSINANG
jgi:hypothetical protein